MTCRRQHFLICTYRYRRMNENCAVTKKWCGITKQLCGNKNIVAVIISRVHVFRCMCNTLPPSTPKGYHCVHADVMNVFGTVILSQMELCGVMSLQEQC